MIKTMMFGSIGVINLVFIIRIKYLVGKVIEESEGLGMKGEE